MDLISKTSRLSSMYYNEPTIDIYNRLSPRLTILELQVELRLPMITLLVFHVALNTMNLH